MKRKTIIYLADLANTKFGLSPSSVPLGIGYIKAYLVSQLSSEVDIQLFRTFESLYTAIQTKEPDIIGCSSYAWNHWLTVNALTFIKSNFPNIITVIGGANAPEKTEDCQRDLKEFPCIDIIIPDEGEIPFFNLVKVFLQGGRKSVFKTAIDGVFYLSDSKELVTGKPVPFEGDISIFPSPYLNGHLDYFLESGLMPMIQTSRGCPFYCFYCVSGSKKLKLCHKVRKFDTERVIAEIDYVEANAKNRTLRITDDNFGIFPRDIEIARYIAKKRAKTGYPHAIRLYTHKKVNDRIKEIILLLRDLIPMNISFQTLTPHVLKNSGRENINLDEVRDSVHWAHKNNIPATTELIFGLPGETYESFMSVINKLVELRFDSIAMGGLMMLKNTKINTPEIINKYGYKTLFSYAEDGYTKVDQFENVETDPWAVENNLFSFKDYIKFNLFNIIYSLFMFVGYFKETVYMWDNRNVKITDVISEILDKPTYYPCFSQQIERLDKCLHNNLFETEEEVHKVYSQRFSENKNTDKYIGFMNHFILSEIIKGELIHPSNQEKMIDEVIKASTVVFNKCGTGSQSDFLGEMRFAKILVKNVIIPFWEMPQETIILPSPYDLVAWRNEDYRGALSKFLLHDSIKYQLKVRSMSQYVDFVRQNSKKPFYLQSELFFRTFRTSNVRRYMD